MPLVYRYYDEIEYKHMTDDLLDVFDEEEEDESEKPEKKPVKIISKETCEINRNK